MKKITFLECFKMPFKGIGFVNKHKQTHKYIIIPLLINVALLIGLFYLFVFELSDVILNLSYDIFGQPEEDIFLSIISITMYVVMFVLYFLVMPVFFSIFSGILSGIFNSYLYHKVRELEAGIKPPQLTFGQELNIFFLTIKVEILKIIVFMLFMIGVLLLNIIPVVGQILSFGIGIFISAIFLGWDLLGTHFETLRYGFKEQFRYVFKNRKISVGLGLPSFLLMYIPLLNLYFVSTNSAGAALLSIKLEE